MLLSNLTSMSDGTRSLLEIADFLGVAIWDLYDPLDRLINAGVVSVRPAP